MEGKRMRLSRVCALSSHPKCLGGWDNPIRGWLRCDCPCHETLPTLFTDLDQDGDDPA